MVKLPDSWKKAAPTLEPKVEAKVEEAAIIEIPRSVGAPAFPPFDLGKGSLVSKEPINLMDETPHIKNMLLSIASNSESSPYIFSKTHLILVKTCYKQMFPNAPEPESEQLMEYIQTQLDDARLEMVATEEPPERAIFLFQFKKG